MLTHLSLRRSLPLLLGLGALLFSVLLVTTLLPRSLDEAQRTWRNHVNQSLILLQSSLVDHLRQGRQAELENDLADLATDELIQKKRVDPRRRNRDDGGDKGGILAEYGLSEEQGNEIIMAARAHWFEEEA